MKLLIMCEGPNELKIINILLENQKLKFTSDDLLGLVPYHARQIKSSAAVKAALNLYPDEVHVLRIGDGQNEKLEIPSAYKDKITLVEKYCTKPELEMLLIISEDLADEYEKVKSKTKPKTFAKANIRCGKRRYDNSTAFYEEYFGQNCEKLVAAIKAYTYSSIHGVKGETFDALMLLIHGTVGNTLTPSFLANGKTNTELMRIAYVAMTRPRKLLVVAMPKNKAKLSNRFPPDKWDYVEL